MNKTLVSVSFKMWGVIKTGAMGLRIALVHQIGDLRKTDIIISDSTHISKRATLRVDD